MNFAKGLGADEIDVVRKYLMPISFPGTILANIGREMATFGSGGHGPIDEMFPLIAKTAETRTPWPD